MHPLLTRAALPVCLAGHIWSYLSDLHRRRTALQADASLLGQGSIMI